MKKLVAIPLCFLAFYSCISIQAMGQSLSELKKKFQKTKNDSLFISNFSDVPYEVIKLKPSVRKFKIVEGLFDAPIGKVMVFGDRSQIYLTKVIKADMESNERVAAHHVKLLKGLTYATGKSGDYDIRIPARWRKAPDNQVKADVLLYNILDPRTNLNIHLTKNQELLKNTTIEKFRLQLMIMYPVLNVTYSETKTIGKHFGFYLELAYCPDPSIFGQIFTFEYKKKAYIVTMKTQKKQKDFMKGFFTRMIEDIRFKTK